jgi:hypothetical protein
MKAMNFKSSTNGGKEEGSIWEGTRMDFVSSGVVLWYPLDFLPLFPTTPLEVSLVEQVCSFGFHSHNREVEFFRQESSLSHVTNRHR